MRNRHVEDKSEDQQLMEKLDFFSKNVAKLGSVFGRKKTIFPTATRRFKSFGETNREMIEHALEKEQIIWQS